MTVSLVNRSEAIEVSPTKHGSDPVAWLVAMAAAVISTLSFVYFYHQGTIMAYADTVSHMEIADRIINSPVHGFGQLGGVWLPLPHLLMLLFVWNNWLFYSGLAGSITSMASYVIASVFLYKMVYDLTGKKLPAIVGALVFMLNPNVLYMQSTPMTELLLFVCMLAMVYFMQRWIRTDQYKYLIYSGIAAFLGTLSRYEAWVLFAALFVVMFYAGWRKGYGQPLAMIRGAFSKRYREKEHLEESRLGGIALAFLFVGGLGIVGWIAWCGLLLSNLLYFQDGAFAKPSLWVGVNELAVGHWSVAFKTYWYAMADNLHLVIVLLMLVGVLVILVKERLSLVSLPTLTLLVMFPFYVYALYSGQRPLHVMQVQYALNSPRDMYNVRFGLLMLLPAAILIGYLVAQFSWQRFGKILVVGCCSAVTIAVVMITVQSYRKPSSIATEADPVSFIKTGFYVQSNEASRYLKPHYHGGLILLQSFGNELLLFKAHISLGEDVYEGSYKLWNKALDNPAANHIKWIVMRSTGPADDVYKKLHGSNKLSSYKLVYHNSKYLVYERK